MTNCVALCVPDEETPGLYGFLHVIVHSAKGFKESASKSLSVILGLYCTVFSVCVCVSGCTHVSVSIFQLLYVSDTRMFIF